MRAVCKFAHTHAVYGEFPCESLRSDIDGACDFPRAARGILRIYSGAVALLKTPAVNQDIALRRRKVMMMRQPLRIRSGATVQARYARPTYARSATPHMRTRGRPVRVSAAAGGDHRGLAFLILMLASIAL